MTDEEKKAHHCEKELAQFIRSGASRRPEQAFGDYYRGRSASCALGAAYEGMYRLPAQASGLRPTKDLEWFFDCLEGSCGSAPAAMTARSTLSLAAIMVHLNDHHKWSREQIAGWLEA
jgi:hypothetical protein